MNETPQERRERLDREWAALDREYAEAQKRIPIIIGCIVGVVVWFIAVAFVLAVVRAP